MAKVYQFKAASKYGKGLWRRIEIRDDQTLGDLDKIMREAFNYDTCDHLSEFFPDQSCISGFGWIDPNGEGPGADIRISTLGLHEGIKIGYMYDFGDWIERGLTLEEIKSPGENVKYPCITDKSKPRVRYCGSCKNKGKKSVAEYVCIDCSNEEGNLVNLCGDCADEKHDDHYIDEILY